MISSFIIFIIYYVLCPLFHIRSSLNISTEYRYIIQIQTGSHPGILPSDLPEIYSSSHHKIITCSTGKFSFWNICTIICNCCNLYMLTGFLQIILCSLSKIYRGYIKVFIKMIFMNYGLLVKYSNQQELVIFQV